MPPAGARATTVSGTAMPRESTSGTSRTTSTRLRAARDALARRAGLGADPRDDELRAAAARFGLGEAETAAIMREPQDLEGALAAGRALAAVNGREAG